MGAGIEPAHLSWDVVPSTFQKGQGVEETIGESALPLGYPTVSAAKAFQSTFPEHNGFPHYFRKVVWMFSRLSHPHAKQDTRFEFLFGVWQFFLQFCTLQRGVPSCQLGITTWHVWLVAGPHEFFECYHNKYLVFRDNISKMRVCAGESPRRSTGKIVPQVTCSASHKNQKSPRGSA